LLLTIFYAPSVFALGFGAQARYWVPTLKGDLRVDSGSIVGTKVDLKDDLGISNENIPVVEAFFSIGDNEITFSYSLIEFSGDKNIGKTVVFHGGYLAMSLKIDHISDIFTTMDFYGPYAGRSRKF
jgi:hypothetical protein